MRNNVVTRADSSWAGRVIWLFSTGHTAAWARELESRIHPLSNLQSINLPKSVQINDKDPFGRSTFIPVLQYWRFQAGLVVSRFCQRNRLASYHPLAGLRTALSHRLIFIQSDQDKILRALLFVPPPTRISPVRLTHHPRRLVARSPRRSLPQRLHHPRTCSHVVVHRRLGAMGSGALHPAHRLRLHQHGRSFGLGQQVVRDTRSREGRALLRGRQGVGLGSSTDRGDVPAYSPRPPRVRQPDAAEQAAELLRVRARTGRRAPRPAPDLQVAPRIVPPTPSLLGLEAICAAAARLRVCPSPSRPHDPAHARHASTCSVVARAAHLPHRDRKSVV